MNLWFIIKIIVSIVINLIIWYWIIWEISIFGNKINYIYVEVINVFI